MDLPLICTGVPIYVDINVMGEVNRLKVDFIDKETMCRFDELNRIMVIFDCVESEIMAYYIDGDRMVKLEIKTK